MTEKEYINQRNEILIKCNNEIDVLIDKMVSEGKWVKRFGSDPPEVKKIKDEAIKRIKELSKCVDV